MLKTHVGTALYQRLISLYTAHNIKFNFSLLHAKVITYGGMTFASVICLRDVIKLATVRPPGGIRWRTFIFTGTTVRFLFEQLGTSFVSSQRPESSPGPSRRYPESESSRKSFKLVTRVGLESSRKSFKLVTRVGLESSRKSFKLVNRVGYESSRKSFKSATRVRLESLRLESTSPRPPTAAVRLVVGRHPEAGVGTPEDAPSVHRVPQGAVQSAHTPHPHRPVRAAPVGVATEVRTMKTMTNDGT